MLRSSSPSIVFTDDCFEHVKVTPPALISQRELAIASNQFKLNNYQPQSYIFIGYFLKYLEQTGEEQKHKSVKWRSYYLNGQAAQ